MLSTEEKNLIKKYRHILAAMIDCSLGYFTPRMALQALISQKKHKRYSCEWYFDMAGVDQKGLWGVTDDDLKEVNHDVIRYSFERRHERKNAIKNCLAIADRNIAGNESIGAGYF